MLRHSTCCIEEIITFGCLRPLLCLPHLWLLHNPRTFGIGVLILFVLVTLCHIGSAETLFCHLHLLHLTIDADHVLIQLQVVDARIAPIEPCLTIIINEHSGVNMIPTAIFIERLANGIAERTCGRICHSHTNRHTARETGMSTDVPIELTIALYALTRPCTIVCPTETFQSQRTSVICPVHHVGRTIDTPLLHPKEVCLVFIVPCIDIDPVTMYHRRGVAGKPCLHKRILCRCLQGKKRCPANHC